MLHLSKSKYCSAVQCPKILWMAKNKPEAFDDSVINQAVLDRGNAVGDLAMGLLGEYMEVPFSDLSEMIRKTQELIDAGAPVVAEASFAFEGLFCSVDILKVLGEHRVEFVEVKSSTHVSEIYKEDVAFQYYVLTQLGYAVERVRVACIDSSYVRHGALELDKLFRYEDLTEVAREKQPEVEARVRFLTEYMEQEGEPDCPIGGQCFSPYACGYFGYCGRELPKPNIFDVGGIQLRTKLANLAKGIVSFQDIELKKALKSDKLMQIQHELHDLPPTIDREAIGKFLDKLSWPLYFLDFESFQPAIPPYDDTSPYQQIVFQYSLHYMEMRVARCAIRSIWPGQEAIRGAVWRSSCAGIFRWMSVRWPTTWPLRRDVSGRWRRCIRILLSA